MKQDLLNKEVLAIIDVRQIQKFMFHSNSSRETLGGGNIVKKIIHESLNYAAQNIDTPLKENQYVLCIESEDIPYFQDENVLMQIITNSAGNAFILFRTGALYQKIIRKVSRYFLEKTYILEIATCAVEKTDDFLYDFDQLFRELEKVKACFPSMHPLPPPAIVQKEPNTGEPIFSIVDGKSASKSSLVRLNAAQEDDSVSDMRQIHATKGPNGKSYVAVLHLDGNNMGMTIAKIIPKAKNYEECIRLRRTINRNIEEGFKTTLDNTIAKIKNKFIPGNLTGEDFSHELAILHRGGDDTNIVCNPRLAIPFVEEFAKQLKSAYLWKDEFFQVGFSICAGIAFVYKDTPFIPAFKIAEECCSSAKKYAKKNENCIDGLPGTWFDFEIQTENNVLHIDYTRKSFYNTSESINLQLRPYTLNEEQKDNLRYYGNLQKRINTLQGLKLNPIERKILESSYSAGKVEFENDVAEIKFDGKSLFELLGPPLATDSDKHKVATWYDATILSSFYKEDQQ